MLFRVYSQIATNTSITPKHRYRIGYYRYVFIMLPTKLWMGIKICTPYVRPSVRLSVRTYEQPLILCAQLFLHHLMDFVHANTQWPTWNGDEIKNRILRCCKFYMSYGTLSLGASVSYKHILVIHLNFSPGAKRCMVGQGNLYVLIE